MRLDSCKQLIGLVSATSLVLMSACATQGPVSESSNSQALQAATIPADKSTPSIPVTATTVVPVIEKKAPEQAPEPGTVASVVKKMSNNPFTLYWREKGSYSYHIGNSLNAEYKPGEGLTVQAKQADKAVVCEFNAVGELVNKNAQPDTNDQCSKLMFTLDSELGD